MKLTKARLQKIFNNASQTRKKYRKRTWKHTNTARNRKQFNLRNNTLKKI